MSIWVIILTVGFVVYVGSRFGRALAPGRSLLWWLFLGWILIAACSPESLRPLARLLRVEYISNLVLASATVFLVLQLLIDAGAQYQTQALCRWLVCTLAAERVKFSGSADVGHQTRFKTLVVVPCFNEQESLPSILPKLIALTENDQSITFCVVNDGSKDLSLQILREACPHNFAHHTRNVGVSGALMTGFMVALEQQIPFVVQCDADGQHPVESIAELVRQAETRKTDLLIGSRFTDRSKLLTSTTKMRRLGGRFLTLLLHSLFRHLRISDPTSGFRVYSTRAMHVFLDVMPDSYPEPEMIAIAATRGLTVAEAAVEMSARSAGESSIGGIGSVVYMLKVASALVGLRLRTVFSSR